jgi:hypothetical protein
MTRTTHCHTRQGGGLVQGGAAGAPVIGLGVGDARPAWAHRCLAARHRSLTLIGEARPRRAPR